MSCLVGLLPALLMSNGEVSMVRDQTPGAAGRFPECADFLIWEMCCFLEMWGLGFGVAAPVYQKRLAELDSAPTRTGLADQVRNDVARARWAGCKPGGPVSGSPIGAHTLRGLLHLRDRAVEVSDGILHVGDGILNIPDDVLPLLPAEL